MQCYPRAGAARFPLAFREKERVDSLEGKARICIYIEREARSPRSPERQHGGSTERSHWEADPISAWSLCGHLLPLQYRLNAEHLGFPSSLAARMHYTELDIVTDIRVPRRLCF